MLRALIVGHTGQDGRILWEQLVARGFSLIGISRRHLRRHRAEWHVSVDINHADDVTDLLKEFRPDQIYYLAAHHHSSEQARDNDNELWCNSWAVHVHAFGHFLESAASCCPSARIFYASSSRVFGKVTTTPQDESTPLRPACAYGVTKASAMLLADYYTRECGLKVACGILYNHESPLRSPQFVSRRIVDGLLALKQGHTEKLEIGTFDARVDWGYAPDYTRAMQLILDKACTGNFVIASGITHSVAEMIATAADYLGMEWQDKVVETARLLRRDPQQLCGDASKLRKATGWAPSVDFQQLIRILVDGALERERLAKA